jgi:rhamnogalacturonan endolyase
VIDAFVAAIALAAPGAPEPACSSWGQRGALLYQDDFKAPLIGSGSQWASEVQKPETSNVTSGQGKLVIDAAAGATVWFKLKLSGDVLITYHRKVVLAGGPNDRLSDLNQFWMASEPDGSLAFTRSGKFEDYDQLPMYYAGIGGNTNKTTRLRRYTPDGAKALVAEANDRAHLLLPNHDYLITVEVYHGCTRISVDGHPWLSYADPHPLTSGWFGLRTTWSRQEISGFRVYRLDE